MKATVRETAENHIRSFLNLLGENVTREGLEQTPARVVRAFEEMLSGQYQQPADILKTTFDVACDDIVVVTGIRFTSLCEHHLLPFVGTAAIGYLPNKQVVGLSKLPRLVECFSRRLQVQERMTGQIAEAIDRHLAPLGVGVIVRAHHSCMGCRGVRQQDAEMITSSMLGAFRENATLRAEFLSLLKMN